MNSNKIIDIAAKLVVLDDIYKELRGSGEELSELTITLLDCTKKLKRVYARKLKEAVAGN